MVNIIKCFLKIYKNSTWVLSIVHIRMYGVHNIKNHVPGTMFIEKAILQMVKNIILVYKLYQFAISSSPLYTGITFAYLSFAG